MPANPTKTPLTHLLYLHGFRSSPQSLKARTMAQHMATLHADVTWWCPQLPPSPREAMAMLMRGIADWPRESILNLDKLLTNYLKHRLVRPATVICYKDALTNLMRFGAAKETPVLTLEDLTVNTLLEHRHWCCQKAGAVGRGGRPPGVSRASIRLPAAITPSDSPPLSSAAPTTDTPENTQITGPGRWPSSHHCARGVKTTHRLMSKAAWLAKVCAIPA